jgi:hypothetical protein
MRHNPFCKEREKNKKEKKKKKRFEKKKMCLHHGLRTGIPNHNDLSMLDFLMQAVGKKTSLGEIASMSCLELKSLICRVENHKVNELAFRLVVLIRDVFIIYHQKNPRLLN